MEFKNFRRAISSDPDIIENHPDQIPQMIEKMKENMRNWKTYFPEMQKNMAELDAKKEEMHKNAHKSIDKKSFL